MGYSWIFRSLFFFLIFFITILDLPLPTESGQSYTDLVYKGCAKQQLSDPSGAYAQALSSLFNTLVQQSSKSKFNKANAGGGQTSISGLFQCRGDLSGSDCNSCVKKLPNMMNDLCGQVIAARVQLFGCYMSYEVSGFTQISGMQLLFKMCSKTSVAGSGFEMRRDGAFTVMENGVSSGNGFYTTNYQQVYVIGQCEGDLGTSDCGNCVKTAVQKAQVECGNALAGQVYLHKCYISYNYYPNGVPKHSSSSSSSGLSSGSGGNTGKTVAIILGGTVGVGFLIIFVLFIRGLRKKSDY